MSGVGLSGYTFPSPLKFLLRVNSLSDAFLICSLLGLQTMEFKKIKRVIVKLLLNSKIEEVRQMVSNLWLR